MKKLNWVTGCDSLCVAIYLDSLKRTQQRGTSTECCSTAVHLLLPSIFLYSVYKAKKFLNLWLVFNLIFEAYPNVDLRDSLASPIVISSLLFSLYNKLGLLLYIIIINWVYYKTEALEVMYSCLLNITNTF